MYEYTTPHPTLTDPAIKTFSFKAATYQNIFYKNNLLLRFETWAGRNTPAIRLLNDIQLS